MEKNKTTQQDININIDNTDDAIGWLERFLTLLKDYGPWKIIGGAVLLVFICWFFYFAFNFTEVFDAYTKWKDKQHDERMELRMQMGPKIQSLTDKLTYSIHASRTMVLEMHNGNTGTGGLPFTKCTATYESLNVGVHPIADQYQDQNLSLIPFAHYLFDNGYWCGDIDDLGAYDRSLYYKMKSNNVEHFAACAIKGVENKPIAFMIVTYNTMPDMETHDCNVTREYIRHVAMELSIILEVNRLLTTK